jgi:cerevisin
MKQSTILPLAVLAAVAHALVIPNIGSQDVFSAVENVAHQGEVAVKDIAQEAKTTIDTAVLNQHLLNTEEAAALISTESAGRNVIPNRYIVVFKKGVKPEEAIFHQEWVAQEHVNAAGALLKDEPTNEFFQQVEAESLTDTLGGILDQFHIDGLLSGYFGYFLDDTIDLIRRNPLVEFVEKDSRVFASEFDTQNGAPWGLSRISHRKPLNLGSFNKYLYDNEAGEGVTSYVIDTGVNVKHVEFEGRASWGKTIPQGDEDLDGNGHGTHCAGTIGSKKYGVAKKADIVAVKVLRSNGSGTMSDVVKGVEYAANSHVKAVKDNKKGFKGSTANMSLGGGKSPSLDLAVNAAVQAGIHFAVAAGNDNADACNYSPAAAEKAVTVGASTLSDSRAYFSNYGKCVDIFGPGLNILSTYIGSETATATLSGTSMASPHVAGLLTYYLSLYPDSKSEFASGKVSVTPAQLKKKIIEYSTKNSLDDIPEDTPNYLIYNGAGQDLTEFWNVSEESETSYDVDAMFQELESKAEHLLEDVKHFISNNI